MTTDMLKGDVGRLERHVESLRQSSVAACPTWTPMASDGAADPNDDGKAQTKILIDRVSVCVANVESKVKLLDQEVKELRAGRPGSKNPFAAAMSNSDHGERHCNHCHDHEAQPWKAGVIGRVARPHLRRSLRVCVADVADVATAHASVASWTES